MQLFEHSDDFKNVIINILNEDPEMPFEKKLEES